MSMILDQQSGNATGTTTTTTTYKVYATDRYQNFTFDHWQDTGSTDRFRTLTIDKGMTLTAYYRQEASGPKDNKPPTMTISQDTHLDSLFVKAGERLLIEHNVTVTANNVTNYGRIINNGTLYLDGGSNAGSGIMDNYGTLGFSGITGNFSNNDGGTINVHKNSRFVFDKVAPTCRTIL